MRYKQTHLDKHNIATNTPCPTNTRLHSTRTPHSNTCQSNSIINRPLPPTTKSAVDIGAPDEDVAVDIVDATVAPTKTETMPNDSNNGQGLQLSINICTNNPRCRVSTTNQPTPTR